MLSALKEQATSRYVEEKLKRPSEEDTNSKENKRAKTNIEDIQETIFQISSKRKVVVKPWQKSILIDIREYYESGGDYKPGKKGISLTREQWITLSNISVYVDEAIESVRKGSSSNLQVSNCNQRVAQCSSSEPGTIAYPISSKRRVTVKKWKDSILVDIREYYGSDEQMPGRKGISLAETQWKKLKEYSTEINSSINNVNMQMLQRLAQYNDRKRIS